MSAHLHAPVGRRIPLLSIDFCGSMGFVQSQEGFAWKKCMGESRFAHCAAYASHFKQQGVDLQGPFSRNRKLCNTAQSSRRPRSIFIIDIDRNRKQRKIDQGIPNLDNSGRSAVYHLCRHVGPLQPLRDIASSPGHRYLILHHSSNFSRARSCSLETCLNHILGFEQWLAQQHGCGFLHIRHRVRRAHDHVIVST